MAKFDLFTNPYLKGADSPSALGATSGIVSAGLGLYGQTKGAMDAANAIGTEAPGLQTQGQFSTPTFNLGQQTVYTSNLRASDFGKGLVGGGALQGASAGAAFGPKGAVIGAAVGALTGLFGRRAARNRAEQQINQAKSNLMAAQQNFNEQNEESNANRLAFEQYQQLISGR